MINCIYVFGGITDDGVYLNDIWKFHLDENKWEEIIIKNEIPKAKSGHSALIQ